MDKAVLTCHSSMNADRNWKSPERSKSRDWSPDGPAAAVPIQSNGISTVDFLDWSDAFQQIAERAIRTSCMILRSGFSVWTAATGCCFRAGWKFCSAHCECRLKLFRCGMSTCRRKMQLVAISSGCFFRGIHPSYFGQYSRFSSRVGVLRVLNVSRQNKELDDPAARVSSRSCHSDKPDVTDDSSQHRSSIGSSKTSTIEDSACPCM